MDKEQLKRIVDNSKAKSFKVTYFNGRKYRERLYINDNGEVGVLRKGSRLSGVALNSMDIEVIKDVEPLFDTKEENNVKRNVSRLIKCLEKSGLLQDILPWLKKCRENGFSLERYDSKLDDDEIASLANPDCIKRINFGDNLEKAYITGKINDYMKGGIDFFSHVWTSGGAVCQIALLNGRGMYMEEVKGGKGINIYYVLDKYNAGLGITLENN